MDNERKVVDIVEQSKGYFLQEVIEQSKKEAVQYDLEQEFAKSRKNRSLIVPLTIVAVVLAVGVLSAFVTSRIVQKSNEIAVNISDFQDVNLREVLNTAKRLEAQISDATRRKTTLTQELNQQVQMIRNRAGQQIQLLDNENLSDAQRATRIASINSNAERSIANFQDEYQAQIDEIDAEIAVLQEQMAQYDTRQVEEAQKQEELLNSQQAAFDLQLEQQKNYYEQQIENLEAEYQENLESERSFHQQYDAGLIRKYDPSNVYADFNEEVANSLPSTLADYAWSPDSAGSDPFFGYTEIEAYLEQYRHLIEPLQELPHENSIAFAVDELHGRFSQLEAVLLNLWNNYEMSAAQSRHFTYAMDTLVGANRENGYVIDPRDINNIAVYIDKIREIRDGQLGYVFRNADEYIATIELAVSGNEVSASAREVASGKELEPFDIILLNAIPDQEGETGRGQTGDEDGIVQTEQGEELTPEELTAEPEGSLEQTDGDAVQTSDQTEELDDEQSSEAGDASAKQ